MPTFVDQTFPDFRLQQPFLAHREKKLYKALSRPESMIECRYVKKATIMYVKLL